jgi:O-antigen/teichoic acid export membrane protein
LASDLIAHPDPSFSAVAPAAPVRSRTRAFLHGAGAGYLYQALVMVIGLWLTPFYLRHLGQHDYGLWLVGTQLLGYLALLDLGVTALLPREAAYVTGRVRTGDAPPTELPELAGRVMRIALWQTPVMAIGALLLWRLNPATWGQLRGPLAIALAGMVLLFPARVFHALLAGLQDFFFVNIAQTLSYVVTAGVGVLLVWRGYGLYALAWSWTAGQAVAAVLWIARSAMRHRGAMPRWVPLKWRAAWQYLSRSTWITVARLADVLIIGSDMLIVGKLLGPAAVVTYACTGKLLLVFANQPLLMAGLAMPGLSEMRFAENRERMRQAVTAITQGMLLLTGLLLAVIMLVNRGFVGWWVGKEFYAGTALTVLLIVAVLLRHFSIAFGYPLFCLGYERRLAVQTIADGVLSTLIAILLTRRFGLIGMPIGNICGVCLVGLPGSLMILRRELKVSVAQLLAPFAPWGARVAALLLAAWYLAKVLKLGGFASLTAGTLGAAAVYTLVMWSILRRPPLGQYSAPLISAAARLLGLGKPAGLGHSSGA